MTTRPESYTNDTIQGGSPTRDHARTEPDDMRPGRSLAVWDLMLGLCASAYLAFALFANVDSPLLSIALMVLMAYELIRPHVRGR